MDLKQAVLAGCKRHQKAIKAYFDFAESGEILSTCTLGAAVIGFLENQYGCSINTRSDLYEYMTRSEYMPKADDSAMDGYFVTCFVKDTFGIHGDDIDQIIDLNDLTEYSREDIAKDLDKILS